jgi:hypothetical protein
MFSYSTPALQKLTLEISNVVLDRHSFQNGHGRTLVTVIEEKGRHIICGLQVITKDRRAKQSHLMQLQKIKIAQPTKSLMIAAPKLTVMMVTMEMTLVVVPRHFPYKKQLMSNLCLPSRLINSHIAPRIKITAVRHRQEFPHIRRMLRLIVLSPLLSGLMMSLSLAHINITSQIFRVSRLPGGFMSGLSLNFITCVIRTDKTLLNGLTSHGRNARPTLFEPNVLCSYP